MIQQVLWICVCLLLTVALLEIMWPQAINEGFSSLIGLGDSPFWAVHMPRRGDVGPNTTQEEGGYMRDTRYWSGYTDIQNLGVNHDFCRMVMPKSGSEKDLFFACALGGTEGLSTVKFATSTVRNGLKISRDDYMNKVGDLKKTSMGYCRILKVDDYTFQPKCNPSTDLGFKDKMVLDYNPPEPIQILLDFYEGIYFWLRFADDLVDYAENLTILKGGGLTIEEMPPIRLLEVGNLPTQGVPRTLEFNGLDQFLRLGEVRNGDLEFGSLIDLRYMRGFSAWVYYSEFTNNAKVFDFGDGAARNNVFLGIIGRGNEQMSQKGRVPSCNESTVPDAPSGAQTPVETTPENLMLTSSANVDEYTCTKPEVYGRIMPPIQPKAADPKNIYVQTADLIYEIWDTQQRKLHVQINGFFPVGKWVHVAVTATSADATRPAIAFYKNGDVVYTEEGGWLPQASATTNNYIGKSNWSNTTATTNNPDELFKGKMFDIRGYNTFLTPKKIKSIYKWGKDLLKI